MNGLTEHRKTIDEYNRKLDLISYQLSEIKHTG